MTEPVFTDEAALAGAALALAGDTNLTDLEVAVAETAKAPTQAQVKVLRAAIGDGQDPLGTAFTALRSPEERRPLGATYTPAEIIESMVAWAADQCSPDRVVDPGAGSGRFAVAAGREFPNAHLVAVEIDPLAALCARANLAVAGMAGRSTVVVGDFRDLDPAEDGRSLFLGNPPYVRHHQISPEWKDWLAATSKRLGHHASKLAGLHVHFFLATAAAGRPGDVGCYITAAEWMDVNYGSLVRQLLLDGLGGLGVHVLDPKALPFSDAATTGAISCFKLGEQPTSMRLRRVEKVTDLGRLTGGRPVRRERLVDAPRWSVLLRTPTALREGTIELGELCRVHRGTVTGANGVWVTTADDERVPDRVKEASVTKAKELFAAGDRITEPDQLRRVIDLPPDLDVFDDDERRHIDRFLRWAKKQGVDKGYIASHRKAWWSVGLREPAPILATYMARRTPAFVRNVAAVRHINIAHGLYPREPMPPEALDRLATALRETVTLAGGRTYAGGLVKFEPREMERLPIPGPDLLLAT